MSRCVACDKILNNYELKRKHSVTGEYLDLCNQCLRSIEEVVYIEYTGHSADVKPVEEEQDE